MPASIAFLVCIIGIAVLFYLNRDSSVRVSGALWIPVVWLLLIGSRPASSWFSSGSAPISATSNLDGSPVDAAVYLALIVVGVIVLVSRGGRTTSYLAVLAPIIIYFLYCLVSVSWSPVPLPSLKRWIKDVGDVAMVLIIVTEVRPLAALRRVYAWVGFILFPLSLFLIRYTNLGRAWDNDGGLSIVGVTTNKNMFGLILFAITLGVFWNFRRLLMNKSEPDRVRRLVAQGILLALGLGLLRMAHSATSLTCFFVGCALMLATHLRAIKYRPSRVGILGLSVFALAGLAIFIGGSGDVANALGRDSSFSGRTDIWAALLPAVSNPLFGTGFDSFWNSPNVLIFQRSLRAIGWWHPEGLNEAHNGYLDVYLNLGAVGLGLVLLILFTGYARTCKAFRRDREVGGLMLAYIVTGMFYSMTEAGFRTLSVSWFFILLAVVSVSGVNAGLFPDETVSPPVPRRTDSKFSYMSEEPAVKTV